LEDHSRRWCDGHKMVNVQKDFDSKNCCRRDSICIPLGQKQGANPFDQPAELTFILLVLWNLS
jgi:hypothetical protein